eukprot:scaffold79153_cov30-Attheya_sp.AAC.1
MQVHAHIVNEADVSPSCGLNRASGTAIAVHRSRGIDFCKKPTFFSSYSECEARVWARDVNIFVSLRLPLQFHFIWWRQRILLSDLSPCIRDNTTVFS